MLELNQIYNEDCLGERGMCLIPDKSVDMILCDLPYGTTACAWDSIIPLDALWAEYKRIIKDDGAIVLTAAQPFTTALIASNLPMFKYAWVWKKTKAADFVNAKNKPMRNHEDVAVFSKGATANGARVKMRYNPQGLTYRPRKIHAGASKFGNIAGKRPSHQSEYESEYENYPMSVLEFANEGNTVHPTQKPVALFEYLIRTYTNDGDTVLDNCMGSGTSAAACIATRRNFIGFELDREYHRIANERIANVQSALFV